MRVLLRGRVGAGAGVYAGAVACIVAAMPLDDLLRLVETLRARIKAHGDLLGQNETRTRYALIDPLLRALGWDVEDPTQVVPEYSLAANRADYALLRADGKPAVIVEAKRLNRPLADGLDQSIAYCVAHGTPYFCVTDGRLWALYETFRQVAIDQKLVTQFDVADSPADVCLADVCLKAMALWRPGVQAGQVRPAEPPVVTTITKPQPDPVATPPGLPPGWTSLDQLQPQKGDKPAELRLSDGRVVSTKSWASFRSEMVAWLVNQGHLSEDQSAQHKQYYGSGSWLVTRARKLIGDAGLDPAQFWVRLQD